MREKNPYNGIYYALGPHDVFPADYQYLNYKPGDTTIAATNAKAILKTIDEKINIGSTFGNYSSISSDTDPRTKFKEHGFYVKGDVTTDIILDSLGKL